MWIGYGHDRYEKKKIKTKIIGNRIRVFYTLLYIDFSLILDVFFAVIVILIHAYSRPYEIYYAPSVLCW